MAASEFCLLTYMIQIDIAKVPNILLAIHTSEKNNYKILVEPTSNGQIHPICAYTSNKNRFRHVLKGGNLWMFQV